MYYDRALAHNWYSAHRVPIGRIQLYGYRVIVYPQISQITPQRNRLRISQGKQIITNVRWRLRNLSGLI